MNALLKKPPRGRPKLNETGASVSAGRAISDSLLCAPARAGCIVAARLVQRSGICRLLVRLSWLQGEFTVTCADSDQVREWRTADQALKRLCGAYGYVGRVLYERHG